MIIGFKFGRGIIYDPYSWEVVLNLSSVEVIAETRRLNARWTPELAMDIQAFHGIDAEAELTRILSDEIYREMANGLEEYVASCQWFKFGRDATF